MHVNSWLNWICRENRVTNDCSLCTVKKVLKFDKLVSVVRIKRRYIFAKLKRHQWRKRDYVKQTFYSNDEDSTTFQIENQ